MDDHAKSVLILWGPLQKQTPFTVFVATILRIPHINIHGVDYKFVTINKTKLWYKKPDDC